MSLINGSHVLSKESFKYTSLYLYRYVVTSDLLLSCHAQLNERKRIRVILLGFSNSFKYNMYMRDTERTIPWIRLSVKVKRICDKNRTFLFPIDPIVLFYTIRVRVVHSQSWCLIFPHILMAQRFRCSQCALNTLAHTYREMHIHLSRFALHIGEAKNGLGVVFFAKSRVAFALIMISLSLLYLFGCESKTELLDRLCWHYHILSIFFGVVMTPAVGFLSSITTSLVGHYDFSFIWSYWKFEQQKIISLFLWKKVDDKQKVKSCFFKDFYDNL